MSYMIRKAEKGNLPRIYEIYETARQFMRENGNHAQWGAGDRPEEDYIGVFSHGGDRPEELLEDDISQGNLYVLEDAVADEAIIHAVFAFIEGEDPVYLKIEQGSWMVDTEYAAVHRVASDGTVRNVLEKIMDYCKAQIPHLRIDTHEDNKVMQHVLEKYGFVRCGIVYVPDGSPRIAYELLP